MKIKVWKEYSGNRCKKPIATGVYDWNDNRLQGVPYRYLIDNGNAHEVVIEDEPVIEEVPKKRRTRSDKGSTRKANL